MRLAPGFIACAVFALGCDRPAPPQPGAVTAPSAPTSVTPAKETWGKPHCSEIFARYRAALAAAKGTCKADTDCARYGGVDPEKVCGGVTDVETARTLTRLGDEATAAGCPRAPYSCPALEPHCVSGVCR